MSEKAAAAKVPAQVSAGLLSSVPGEGIVAASTNIPRQISRPAIFPRKEGHDHVVIVRDGDLHVFQVEPDGKMEKKYIWGVGTPIVSNAVPVINSTSGDWFELVMFVEPRQATAPNSRGRLLRVLKVYDTFSKAGLECRDLGTKTPRDYIGDPCVIQTMAGKKLLSKDAEDVYFVASTTADELVVNCRTSKFYESTIEKTYAYQDSVKLLAPVNGLAATLDCTGMPRMVAAGNHQAKHYRVAGSSPADSTWSLVQTTDIGADMKDCGSCSGFLALHQGCDPNPENTIDRGKRVEMISVEEQGLVNRYHGDITGNTWKWAQVMIAEPAHYGRPVVEVLGQSLIVVVRAGQKLKSFMASPDYTQKDIPRQWRALPDFGNSATGDPVMFRRTAARSGFDCLVVVVELAEAGLGYYWFNGSRWVAGWP